METNPNNHHSIDVQNNSENETSTRKKSKKRDRSPPLSDTQHLSIGATSAESNETTTNNAVVVGQKKEKQRPETWNKVEQQIFFNALRQVIKLEKFK